MTGRTSWTHSLMIWGRSESKQKHCSLSLFASFYCSLSFTLAFRSNEWVSWRGGGGSLECRDRKCVLAERAVRASCRRSTQTCHQTHTQPTWIIWMSWVSCSMLGQECCYPKHTVKEQLQILSFSSFLLSLSLFFFYISAHHFARPLCYSHTNSVIIQTLNKLCNQSCPLPTRGCAVLKLDILNISYWRVSQFLLWS